jgi:O-antigen ligase
MASALWSLDPAITIRRSALLCVVSACVMLSVHSIGPSRALQLLCYVFAAVVALDLLSVAVIPQALHTADGAEPQLAGDWRGVHGHKNIAGALYVNIVLVALFLVSATRGRSALALAIGSSVFLLGTNSKSSLGLLPVALLAGTTHRLAIRNALNRKRIFVGLALCGAIALAGLCLWWEPLSFSLQNPELFTGRVGIWQAEWAYVSDHFLLGSGFGSFSYTGKSSPIYDYIGSAWTGTVANGHQGYLELLVTVGVPGFVLTLIALLVEPLVLFGARSRLSLPCRALLFSLFVFFFLHNFMESDFLKTDDAEWVVFLLAFTLLRTSSVGPGQAFIPADR